MPCEKYAETGRQGVQAEGLWGAGAGTGGLVVELSGSPFFDFPPLPPLPVFPPLPPLKPFCQAFRLSLATRNVMPIQLNRTGSLARTFFIEQTRAHWLRKEFMTAPNKERWQKQLFFS